MRQLAGPSQASIRSLMPSDGQHQQNGMAAGTRTAVFAARWAVQMCGASAWECPSRRVFRGQHMAVTLMVWFRSLQAAAAAEAAVMAAAATVALRGTTQKSPPVICL